MEAVVVKPSKLYQRLLATRASMRFRDFQRVLEAFGFTLDRSAAVTTITGISLCRAR